MTPLIVSVLQALRMDNRDFPWEPGQIAVDHDMKPVLWYRGSTREWSADMRKDEDPRHQWVHQHVDCDRCEMSVYDMQVLGKHDVICEGERRNAAGSGDHD